MTTTTINISIVIIMDLLKSRLAYLEHAFCVCFILVKRILKTFGSLSTLVT